MKKLLFCVVFIFMMGLTGCSKIVAPSAEDLLNGSLVNDSKDYFSYNISYSIDLLLDLDMIIEKADFTELDNKGIMPVSISADMSYLGNSKITNIRGSRQMTYPDKIVKKSLNNWYQTEDEGTTVYQGVDNQWSKVTTDEKFDWFLNFDEITLVGVSMGDVSMSDTRYNVSATIDWYGLNKILHLDNSIDEFKKYGVDFDNVIFRLSFEYDVDTYKLRSLEVTLDSDVDMTGRSLIFDGFVLHVYPDYPSEMPELIIPSDVLESVDEIAEEETIEVDNTIRVNMMIDNPDGYSGESFMAKVRDYFSLSDVDCRTFTDYDMASSAYRGEGYSLKLSIQVFRGSATAEGYMPDVNEEFYMNYLSEYFGGEIVNKSEKDKIYVYSVSKFNPVEVHMRSGNAVISITGSTDEGVSPDVMFERINGFIEFLERQE